MSVKPDDCVPPLLYREVYVPGGWGVEGVANPERHPGPCRVYWGSHGCSRPIGHEGPHWCDCCDRFYGDDVPGWKEVMLP